MNRYAEISVFLVVVETGSFSAAARRMGRSPSAISKLIGRLERRLNARLFDRIGNVIRLTHEGELLATHGRRVHEAMNQAEEAVHASRDAVTGTLRVHTPLTFAKYQLAPLLPAFVERHPALDIRFVLGTARGDFLRDRIDVAIHSEAPPEQSLIARPIMRRRWLIAAAPAYLRRHGVPTRPGELAQHRCLNFTVRIHWNAWSFNDGGMRTFVDVSRSPIGADQGELLRTLAIEGLGIARLAEFHIGADVRAGRLVQLLAEYRDPVDDLMYVLYPDRRSQPRRIRAFLDFLDEHFQP